jgi:hypothetical protein
MGWIVLVVAVAADADLVKSRQEMFGSAVFGVAIMAVSLLRM